MNVIFIYNFVFVIFGLKFIIFFKLNIIDGWFILFKFCDWNKICKLKIDFIIIKD